MKKQDMSTAKNVKSFIEVIIYGSLYILKFPLVKACILMSERGNWKEKKRKSQTNLSRTRGFKLGGHPNNLYLRLRFSLCIRISISASFSSKVKFSMAKRMHLFFFNKTVCSLNINSLW